MLPKPMPPFFLIKIPNDKKKNNSSIIIPDTLKFMAYNYQYGEIVSIGEKAHQYFPEAKIGQLLICHHFVEGLDENDARIDHLIHSDATYNYYVVTAYEFNGKNCETYGVWDGEKIIPNKDYIFLEKQLPPKESDIDLEELGKEIGFVPNVAMTKSDSGLLLFKEWEESRESMEQKQQYLKEHNEHLTRSNPNKSNIQEAISNNEREMSNISVRLNKKEYIKFKISFYHPCLTAHNTIVKFPSFAYVYNLAANTEVEFNNKTYIIAKSKYVGVIQ